MTDTTTPGEDRLDTRQVPGPPTTARSYASSDTTVDERLWRNIGKWTVAFLLFISMSALLVSLMLFQLTAEGASKRTLRRAVAALTEIDPLVERHYTDLQQQAQASKPGDSVVMAEFPIAIALKPDQVRGASKDQIRDLLLDRSSDLLYDSGTAPLRSKASTSGSVGRFTIAGLTDDGLGFLRSRNHDILLVITIVLAVITGALTIALTMLCRGFGRLASIGLVIVTAAMPVVLFGIGARFYMRILSDGDSSYIQREFLEIGQGLAWIPIRDGLAFMALGVCFLIAGFAGARWADSRRDAGRAYASAHTFAR